MRARTRLLICAWIAFVIASAPARAREIREGVMRTSDVLFEDFLFDAVKRTDGRARRLMLAAFIAGRGAIQRRTVETSGVPLAVVNGGADHTVNNDYLKGVDYANLWEGTVHILDGVGHAPFWEAPDRFDPILERFLADATGV